VNIRISYRLFHKHYSPNSIAGTNNSLSFQSAIVPNRFLSVGFAIPEIQPGGAFSTENQLAICRETQGKLRIALPIAILYKPPSTASPDEIGKTRIRQMADGVRASPCQRLLMGWA
jgi:hypothetical protein